MTPSSPDKRRVVRYRKPNSRFARKMERDKRIALDAKRKAEEEKLSAPRCDNCDGEGTVVPVVGEEELPRETCVECKGSGAIRKKGL